MITIVFVVLVLGICYIISKILGIDINKVIEILLPSFIIVLSFIFVLIIVNWR